MPVPGKTRYRRDVERGVKRWVIRMTKPERAKVEASRARHGTYAPTISALVRRGLELACEELDSKPPQG